MTETITPFETIHGVALAVGALGLLILGNSGSGKSSLAASMLADWPFGKVQLVADDRVLLTRAGSSIVARAHPLIARKLEIRGYGIVEAQNLDAVVVAGVITLSNTQIQRLPTPEDGFTNMLGVTLPTLHLMANANTVSRLITIWPYFSGQLRKD